MRTFRSVPFFRILLPFISGIIAAVYFQPPLFSLTILILLLIVFLSVRRYMEVPEQLKLATHIIFDCFLFCAAVILVQHSDLRNRSDFFTGGEQTQHQIDFVAFPADLPVQKGKWRRAELKVTHIRKKGRMLSASGRLLCYFRDDVDSAKLQPGQPLFLRARLLAAPPPLNPGEFDYRNWLANRQIFHTCFVGNKDVFALDLPREINPLWAFGLRCRQYLLNALQRSGLNQESYAICAALLTGQDDDIDRDTMTAFAHSGTLHVLSVSGLHTGLVYLALDFLFGLFGGKKGYKVQRFLCITAGLWLFGLMTGFAAPVLRAVIMFNLMGYGRIFFRNDARNQLNILFVSAFILLFYNPFFLFEVGFLLSYFALFGLIVFTPPFMRLWQPANYFSDFSWKSLCASVAATLSTLPITLFYFKQFPIWFFLCNLVVVPASTLLLLLSVLLVLKLGFLAPLANWLVHALVYFIHWFNKPGFGYVDGLNFDGADVVFFTMFIILVSMAINQRSFSLSASALIFLIGWQLYGLAQSYHIKDKNLLTVYHLRKQRAASIKNRQQLRYFVSDSTALDYHIRPHFISMNNPAPSISPFNYLKADSTGVLFINGRLSAYKQIPPGVNVLVLSSGSPLPEDLRAVFPDLRLLVCDGSNSAEYIDHARLLSRKFGIGFHNTAEQGALQLAIK